METMQFEKTPAFREPLQKFPRPRGGALGCRDPMGGSYKGESNMNVM